jgi:hypothetical protein
MATQEPTAQVTIGTVISTRRWSETNFEVYGRKNAPRFYTDVTQRQEVFVQDAQGRETRWYVNPDNVGFREGSKFIAVTGQESEAHEQLLHFVANPDSNEAYSQPAPMRVERSIFDGIGLGLLAAIITAFLVMVLFAQSTSTKAPVRDLASFMPTKEQVQACPFGSNTPLNWNKYPRNGCPDGSTFGVYPYVGACSCAKSANDFAKTTKFRYEEISRQRRTAQENGATATAIILGSIVGLIAWLIGFIRHGNKTRAKAEQLREKYAQAIVAEAAKHGLKLEVVDKGNMDLRWA